MLLPALIAMLAFFTIVMIFVGLSMPRGTEVVQARLSQYGARQVRSLEDIELDMSFSDRVIKPILQGFARLFSRFTPQKSLEQVQHQLDLAGNPNNWTPSEFLGVRVFAALGTGGLLLFVSLMSQAGLQQTLLLSGGSAVLGFILPSMWLGSKARTRQKEIQNNLPDALDLLTIGVEAGLGLDAGMTKVADKFDNELGRAFGRVISEVRVGKPKSQALRDMANRADVSDLSSFVTALIQAEQLGVSMSKVLRVQSEQMRIRRRQRAEEEAHKAPTKMSFVLVLFLLPSLCMVMMGPVIPRLCRQFSTTYAAICGKGSPGVAQ